MSSSPSQTRFVAPQSLTHSLKTCISMERTAFLNSLDCLIPSDPSYWPSSNEDNYCRHGDFRVSIEPSSSSRTQDENDIRTFTFGPVMTTTDSTTATSSPSFDPTVCRLEIALVPDDKVRHPSTYASSSSASTTSDLKRKSSPEGATPDTTSTTPISNVPQNLLLLRIDESTVYQMNLDCLRRVHVAMPTKLMRHQEEDATNDDNEKANHHNKHRLPPPSVELLFRHDLVWRIFCYDNMTATKDAAATTTTTMNDNDEDSPTRTLHRERLAALATDIQKAKRMHQHALPSQDTYHATPNATNGQDSTETMLLTTQQEALEQTWQSIQSLQTLLNMPASSCTSSSSSMVGPVLTTAAQSFASSYCSDTARIRACAAWDRRIHDSELEQELSLAFPPPRRKQRTLQLEGTSGGIVQRVQQRLEQQRHATEQKYRLALLPRRGYS